jgi:hypothetical protein
MGGYRIDQQFQKGIPTDKYNVDHQQVATPNHHALSAIDVPQ